MYKKLKTTITLAPHIKDFASKEAKSLGLDFSAYITVLIAEKMRGNVITPPTKTSNDDEADKMPADNKQEIAIDSDQENEINRLLEW